MQGMWTPQLVVAGIAENKFSPPFSRFLVLPVAMKVEAHAFTGKPGKVIQMVEEGQFRGE
jgi:hypothetical protein